MKNLIFFVMALLCLLRTNLCTAQSADSMVFAIDNRKSFTENFDAMFAGIGKQGIASGIWYDRVMPVANLTKHDSSTLVSKAYYIQAYYELYNATLSNASLRTITQVTDWLAYYKQYDTLAIGIINCSYNVLNHATLPDSTVYITNGALQAGPNVASLFATKQILFGAILADKLQLGKAYRLQTTNLVLQNSADKVKNIYITTTYESGESSRMLISNGSVFTIEDYGKIALQVEVQLMSGKTIINIQNLDVDAPPGQRVSSYTSQSCQSFPYGTGSVVANPTLAFTGISGQAEVAVFPRIINNVPNNPQASTCPNTIAKPVIVLDGIDNQNGRPTLAIYEGYLKYANPLNTADTLQIGDSIRRLGFDIMIFNPIVYTNPQNANLVVDGGDDFIERNGLVLVQLIQNVNADLDAQALASGLPRQDICIAGPSMGGQISRYALAFMEEQLLLTGNPIWNHRCKLWLSLDSPNEGANIAIGLQAFVKFLAQTGGQAAMMYDGFIKSPASNQLLIHQSDNSVGAIDAYQMNNTSPQRISWMNTISGMLGGLGYPQNCKKIAIANGSSKGGNYHISGDPMLNVQAGTSPLIHLNLNTNFLPNIGNSFIPFEATVPVVNDYTISVVNAQIVISLSTVITQIVGSTVTNNSVFGAIDACPGSFYNVQGTLVEAINTGIPAAITGFGTVVQDSINVLLNGLPNFLSNILVNLNNVIMQNLIADLNALAASQISYPVSTSNISFISSVSALGFINPNFNWSWPIPDLLICNNLIPFDAYYIPKENQDHVSFTQESWRWLKQELLKGHIGSDCTLDKCGYSLNGNTEPCDGYNYTYFISPAPPANITVKWSYPGDFGFTAPTTTSGGTDAVSGSFFEPQSWGQGQTEAPGFVIAELVNPCGNNVILQLPITAFKNTIGYDGFQFYLNQRDCIFNIFTTYYPNTTYTWWDVDPNLGGVPTVTNSNQSPFGPYAIDGVIHDVWVKFSTDCFGGSSLMHNQFANSKPCDRFTSLSEWLLDDYGNYDPHDPWDDQDDHDDDWGWDDHDEDHDGPRLAKSNNCLSKLVVTPNPSSSSWIIKTNEKAESVLQARVYDVLGKIVFEKKYIVSARTKFEVPCNQLPTGVYYIEVATNGVSKKVKVVRE